MLFEILLTPPCPPPDISISSADVIKEINSLKNHKAPGISGITNETLKNLPPGYIPKITLLINSILNLCYFPHYWKTALIAPIHKPNKPPEIPSSYRPISLLNSLSKLTEAFIARQIDEHIQNNNVITPTQFGFQSGLSAPHQVYRLVEHISSGKLRKDTTAAVFLDIEKAYDRVWVNGVIFKLINYNFPPNLIKLIFSYLINRNFHVKIKSTLSRNFIALFGLPQGSKISPKLFNIYINDMPTYAHTLLATFADDTCIFSVKHNRRYAISAITHHLKILAIWFSKWRIAINIDKTQAILFSNLQQCNRDKYKIKYHNVDLPWSETCKYLGVILDQKLTFKQHIYTSRNKFRAARNKIVPPFGSE